VSRKFGEIRTSGL